MTSKTPKAETPERHPAYGQVGRIINDVRINYGDGRGTPEEVADRILSHITSTGPLSGSGTGRDDVVRIVTEQRTDPWTSGTCGDVAERIIALATAPTLDDHQAEPEWETSTASDFCLTCGWPVSKGRDDRWAHDAKNPCHWTDRRIADQDTL